MEESASGCAQAADSAHTARLSRIEELAATFAEIEGRGTATSVFKEMTRILTEQGVDEAIAYVAAQRPSILKTVRARAAATRERNRADLQPLLQAAGLHRSQGPGTRGPRPLHRHPRRRSGLAGGPARRLLVPRQTRGTSPASEPLSPMPAATTKKPTAWPSASLPPTPATPNGSATSRFPTKGSATWRWPRASWRRPRAPTATAMGIAKKLCRADPSNTQWQRDLAVSYNKLGDVAAAQGKLEEAARAYGDGLGIVKKLAAVDPSNTKWQRDLAISCNRLGDVAVAQGKLEEAARAYGDGLGIVKKLAAVDPSNTLWQRDLSISYKIGDVAVARASWRRPRAPSATAWKL